jgi:hypothetical protein
MDKRTNIKYNINDVKENGPRWETDSRWGDPCSWQSSQETAIESNISLYESCVRL